MRSVFKNPIPRKAGFLVIAPVGIARKVSGAPVVHTDVYSPTTGVLHLNDLTVGREYRLMRGNDLSGFDMQVGGVTAALNSATLTDPNPPVVKSFNRVAN